MEFDISTLTFLIPAGLFHVNITVMGSNALLFYVLKKAQTLCFLGSGTLGIQNQFIFHFQVYTDQ